MVRMHILALAGVQCDMIRVHAYANVCLCVCFIHFGRHVNDIEVGWTRRALNYSCNESRCVYVRLTSVLDDGGRRIKWVHALRVWVLKGDDCVMRGCEEYNH